MNHNQQIIKNIAENQVVDLNNTLSKIENSIHKNIELINAGGCGYLTYILSKALFKRDISHIINFTTDIHKKFTVNNISSKHVWITINNYEFNRTYRHANKRFKNINKQIIIRDLLKRSYINNRGDWNDKYDTSQNKKIRNIINYYFKQYDNRRK